MADQPPRRIRRYSLGLVTVLLAGLTVAEILVTNTGSVKTTGWRIDLVMPVGFVTVTSSWNATRVPGRPSDFENVSYNGALNPGSSTTFGFIAVRATPGTNMTPNQFFCTAYSPETN